MKMMAIIMAAFFTMIAYAGGEVKEVCKDKVTKSGKVVLDKKGKPVQVCKKIKVHKKVEGSKVPKK